MRRRLRSPAWLLEAFVAVNLLFLVVDIALAHSVHEFAHPAEWVPLVFSAGAGFAVAAGLVARDPRRGPAGVAGEISGWGAVLVGVAGLLWHLSGELFQEVALESLVYSAPFVAPLAYTGLGLLLLLNRRVRAETDPSWGRWVLVLVLAGIVGNFGLSLTDHARNGFFDPLEWLAVGAAAAGVGGVVVAVLWPASEASRRVAWVALGVQVAVGLLGCGLHLRPLLTEPSSADLLEAAIYGPPLFAPLLFANLALPGALGLWALGSHAGPAPSPSDPADGGARMDLASSRG